MQVKDLRKLLEGVPDEMEVLIPATGEFDGAFKHPCVEESGVGELGICESEEEEKEFELLNKPVTKDHFLLVPCGFFGAEHEDKVRHLN